MSNGELHWGQIINHAHYYDFDEHCWWIRGMWCMSCGGVMSSTKGTIRVQNNFWYGSLNIVPIHPKVTKTSTRSGRYLYTAISVI
eukprot:SAG11_NODE_614_length_8201_cov_3.608121_1_plen_85_part_00